MKPLRWMVNEYKACFGKRRKANSYSPLHASSIHKEGSGCTLVGSASFHGSFGTPESERFEEFLGALSSGS